MKGSSGAFIALIITSVLWGTTGTAATFAPEAGPLAIGAAALGIGGLLQALIALPALLNARAGLRAQRSTMLIGGISVAIYPLAFYSAMHLVGVAIGTVVSLASAPLAAGALEAIRERKRPGTWWMVAAGIGMVGSAMLCIANATGGNTDAGAGTSTGVGVGASTRVGGSTGTSAGTGVVANTWPGGLIETAPGAGSTGMVPLDDLPRLLAGITLGLLAGLTYATYTWAARDLMATGVRRSAAMGSVFGVGGLLLMPVLAITGVQLLASPQSMMVAAYMALVPMFIGYVLFGFALIRIRASTATTVTLIEPAVAAVLAVVIVGERLPLLGWMGVSLLGAVLAVLTLAPRSQPRPFPPPAPLRLTSKHTTSNGDEGAFTP